MTAREGYIEAVERERDGYREALIRIAALCDANDAHDLGSITGIVEAVVNALDVPRHSWRG